MQYNILERRINEVVSQIRDGNITDTEILNDSINEDDAMFRAKNMVLFLKSELNRNKETNKSVYHPVQDVAKSISDTVMVVTSIGALDRLVTEWVLKLRKNGKLDY